MTAAEIACALGLRRAGRDFGGQCPSCGYTSGFAVTVRNGALLYYCHAGGCSQSEIREGLQRAGLVPRNHNGQLVGRKQPSVHRERQTQPTEWLTRPNKRFQTAGDLSKAQLAALAIWRRSRSAEGTSVERYLREARSYTGPIPPVLRVAACKHPKDASSHPAMIAAVERAGEPGIVAVHRTFLHPNGIGKADLAPNKMTLGPCKGGAVRLTAAGPILAVAEGIETSLSYMQLTGTPTWAALSAGGMRSLILPENVVEVVIAADPDPVGMISARAAARRWIGEGRRVAIARPPLGFDFNDLARFRAS
jgi:hypothetical protein